MSNTVHTQILTKKYKDESVLLNTINSSGILPYLPNVIIEHILQYFVSITDYITHYIELDYNNGNKHLNYYKEMFPYILQLHNNPKKEEICQNWEYGNEFLLISKRHENGNAFYSSWNNWEESFTRDLEIQIKCISKPRNELSETEKELLKYIMPINKMLRDNYACGMMTTNGKWEIELIPYFQKILDLSVTEQNELLNIWGFDCGSCFQDVMKSNETENNTYTQTFLNEHTKDIWMQNFIIDFMMYKYH